MQSSTPVNMKFEEYMSRFEREIPLLEDKHEMKAYRSNMLDEMDDDQALSDDAHYKLSVHLLLTSQMPPFGRLGGNEDESPPPPPPPPPSVDEEMVESPRHDIPLDGGKSPPLSTKVTKLLAES